ncbi:MAG: hypothetical protein ACMUIP_15155 [bacterium]
MKNIYFRKLAVFLLAFATIAFVMQKNASAQFAPFGFLPAPWLSPIRTASVVTGGGAVPAVDGLWNGIWLSFVKFDGGLLDMILITDPITGLINGTVSLVYNRLIPIPIDVSGAFLPLSTTTFELKGSYLDIVTGDLYTLTMTCNLLAPNVLDGTFSIVSLRSIDYGSFYATLVVI